MPYPQQDQYRRRDKGNYPNHAPKGINKDTALFAPNAFPKQENQQQQRTDACDNRGVACVFRQWRILD